MGIATLAFWAGRNKYVHVPPTGLRRVLEVLRDHSECLTDHEGIGT